MVELVQVAVDEVGVCAADKVRIVVGVDDGDGLARAVPRTSPSMIELMPYAVRICCGVIPTGDDEDNGHDPRQLRDALDDVRRRTCSRDRK